MQQPPHQRTRVEVDQFLLPGDQFDPAFVLAPGSMLGEQARPVLGEGVDLQAAFVRLLDSANLAGQDLCNGQLAESDQFRVALRAGNTEFVDVARAGGEATVPKVESEEIGIRHLR
jgi:hypothetical protein